MRKYSLLPAIFFLTFCACIKLKEQTIIGGWVIDTVLYHHVPLMMPARTPRPDIIPAGFRGKMILRFEKDSTVNFPGIYSYDVPCIWRVNNNEMEIRLDSLRVMNDAFYQFDYLRVQSILKDNKKLMAVYRTKCDSVSTSKDVVDIKNAAKVYTGVYKVKRDGSIITLVSPTTEFELVNQEDALYGRIHQIENGK
jgi:hypothetical protein